MSFQETRDFLYRLRNTGSRYGVERMQLLLKALENHFGKPLLTCPVIHVAGTNGKGSVCAMLEAMGRENGYRTGLYTSPHLVYLGERVQVNRLSIPEARLIEAVDFLKPFADSIAQSDPELYPSFFEFMTAVALLWFRQQRVELAVIEVGLGGRLDATNVLTGDVSVITSIARDHEHILGNTLARIAFEKGGIIKPQKPVVLGNLPEEARLVLLDIASQRRAPVSEITSVFNCAPTEASPLEPLPETCLAGRFQRWNAASALLAARLLSPVLRLDEATCRKALMNVRWEARWEPLKLDDGRTLILDASHNEEGVRELALNLETFVREKGHRPAIVAGVLGIDRARALIPVVSHYAEILYLVSPDQPRACSVKELLELVPPDRRPRTVPTSVADLFPDSGRMNVPPSIATLVSTGSIYMAGEILARVRPAAHSAIGFQDRP